MILGRKKHSINNSVHHHAPLMCQKGRESRWLFPHQSEITGALHHCRQPLLTAHICLIPVMASFLPLTAGRKSDRLRVSTLTLCN